MIPIRMLDCKMKKDLADDLASAGWIGTLTQSLRASLMEAARWREFEPGDVVYASGADGDTLWGIRSGAVKMYIAAGEDRMRFCHAVGPGYWFGELELLLNLPRFIEMRTAGNSRLLCLHARDLHKVAEAHPEIWRVIARLAATNEALAVAGVDDLMLRDPRKRLAATLLRLSGMRWEFQDRRPLNPVPVTLQELSEAANLSRTVAAEIMSEFAEIGALQKQYGRIRIDRPEMLIGVL